MADARYLQKEINLCEYGLGIVKPFTVDKVVNLKDEGLRDFLIPFLYETTIKENDCKLFDLFFIEDEQMRSILNALISSLKMLYETTDFRLGLDKDNNINIIISDASINRNNFDKLCEVIRDLYFIKTQEEENKDEEWMSKVKDKGILEEYLRLESEHKKEIEELNKNNQKDLHQIITIVASQCSWDYDKVFNMTYYRLIITYMSIFQIDNYTTFIQFKSSGQFDMKDQDVKHWSETIGKI